MYNHDDSSRRASSPPRSGSTPINSPPRRFSSPASSGGKSSLYSDRFIPSRTSSNLDDGFEVMEPSESINQSTNSVSTGDNNQSRKNFLRHELYGQAPSSTGDVDIAFAEGQSPGASRSNSNFLKFSSPNTRRSSSGSGFSVLDSVQPPFTASNSNSQRIQGSPKKMARKIARVPYKVLDAPQLQDDYYLNLVDWSSGNILAVALGSSVYLWSASTSKVTNLCDLGNQDSITSITWAVRGSQIAVGTYTGSIQIWDAARGQKIREMKTHSSRVGALAWSSSLLASGSRDRLIMLQDVRVRSRGGVTMSAGGATAPHASPSPSPSSRRPVHHAPPTSPLSPSMPSSPSFSSHLMFGGADFKSSSDDVSVHLDTDLGPPSPSESLSSRLGLGPGRDGSAPLRNYPGERDALPVGTAPHSGVGFSSAELVSLAGEGRAGRSSFPYYSLAASSVSLMDESDGDPEGIWPTSPAGRHRPVPLGLGLGLGSANSWDEAFLQSSTIDSGNGSGGAGGEPTAMVESGSHRHVAVDDDDGDINEDSSADEGDSRSGGSRAGATASVARSPSPHRVRAAVGAGASAVGARLTDRSAMESQHDSAASVGRQRRRKVEVLLRHFAPSSSSPTSGSGPAATASNMSRSGIGRGMGAGVGAGQSPGGASSVGDDDGGSAVQVLSAHKQEVCGLKWSFDERMLASGGNDNKLYVWTPQAGARREIEPTCRFNDHTAAVKAVAWSPHQHGLLASGGGTADRHIRFWNALTEVPLHRVDTGSQVCNLMWSKTVNEIVSTHGYSLNQVIVWKYPSMQKVATLTGHTLRVLYLAMSPDGQSIVTGAGDETLRFWNVFPGPRSGGSVGMRMGPSALIPSGRDIR